MSQSMFCHLQSEYLEAQVDKFAEIKLAYFTG